MIDIKENEQLSKLNHSCAHMMAQAVKRLYPQAKFWSDQSFPKGFTMTWIWETRRSRMKI